MAFDTQITDLVGGTIDQVACDQWAADACKEIIHVLPPELKAKCSTVSTLNNSATTLDMDGIGGILHVTRLSADSGGYQVACREIPAMYGGLATDSTDLNYYGTAADPVFWVDSSSDVSTLKVKPTTTANQTAIVHHITYPTVNVSDVSVIANFPDEAEYLVVLYAAIKQLHQYMNSKRSDLPSDLTLPVLESVSESLPTWSAPSDFSAPTIPVVPTISAIAYTDASNSDASVTAVTTATATAPSIVDVSGNAPAYSKPTITTRVAFSSYTSGLSETDPGIFGLVSVAPSVPSAPSYTTPDVSSTTVASTTVSVIGAPPSYTAPKVTGDTQELTHTITAGAVGTTGDFLNYEHWFDVLTDMIETNEDIEMASVQLNKISTYIQSYQSAMQNQLNIFNKNNVAYQGKLQEGIQQAQINATKAQGQAQISATEAQQESSLLLQKEQQEYSATLQKYQAEVTTYQANVNKEVQGYGQKLQHYSTELNTAYQAWAKTESDSLQQYSTDIQNELNEFNKENVKYQIEYQEASSKANQDLQIAVANANNLAQEYRQEAQQSTQLDQFNKSQDQALNLANAAKVMEKLVQDNNSKLQKYQAEVGVYSAELNTNVQTFTQALTKNRAAFDTSMQKYTSEVQKVSTSNGSTLQKFQSETADYSAKLQKQGMDYQWYQGQYAALKADYQQGLQQLTGGGAPPPAQ